MWPDWASRQLEISPWTEMSVKFLASRSRILPVSSLTVKILRSGMRLKVSCSVMRSDPEFVVKTWTATEMIAPHPGVSETIVQTIERARFDEHNAANE